jgi:hypothetical protein
VKVEEEMHASDSGHVEKEPLDERGEQLVSSVSGEPGISESIATAAYLEIRHQCEQTKEVLSDDELRERIRHQVGFIQAKILMEAMEEAENLGQGDSLAGEIKAVGGRVIMDAMSGDEAAKQRVQEKFSEAEGLEFFGEAVINAEQAYLEGSSLRMAAFEEAEKPEYFNAIVARARLIVEKLRRKYALFSQVAYLQVDSLVQALDDAVTRAEARGGLKNLSGTDRWLLGQAALA